MKQIVNIYMASLVYTLPIVQLSAETRLHLLLPKNNVIINNNDKSIDQVFSRYGPSRLVDGIPIGEQFL